MNQFVELSDLFDQFDAYIHENRYSKHSFIRSIESGQYNLADIQNWATQKYCQVYQQNCNFSAIHSVAIPYEDIRQYQMDQLLAEETGIQDGSDSHYGLMKRFAKAIGVSDDALETAKAGEPINEFFRFQYNYCRQNAILGMLSIYLVESQTSCSAEIMYKAFKERFNLSGSDLEWFSVHSSAEEEHASRAKDLIIKYAHTVDEFERKSWQVIKEGVFGWTQLQDYYASLISNLTYEEL